MATPSGDERGGGAGYPGAGCPALRGWRLALALGGAWAVLVLFHLPQLRLPYFWDEAGYFVPAALDLLRHGWWVPRTTLPNGHPPLLMAVLATAWKLFGFSPLVTRLTMLAGATGVLWGLYRLGELAIGERCARRAVLLFAVTPIFFAQAALAQLDLPATLFILWALVFRWRGRAWAYAVAAAAACLAKDTALIAFFALGVCDLVELARRRAAARDWLRRLAPHLVPVCALAAWYACNHAVTGYWVGNPQYLAYNLGDTAFSLPRILLSLLRRLWQLAGYNGLWLVSLLALAGALSARRSGRRPAVHHRGDILAVLVVYIVFHSILGGAVLDRYLLPAVALYLVLLTPALLALPWVRRAPMLVLIPALFLAVNWFWNPPYPFPYEDNLAWATFVRLHQDAARYLQAHPPNGPVLTSWPATGELADPDLGYVRRPLPVAPVNDFTAASLAAVERRGIPPAALLLYSRQYQPALNLTRVFPLWQRWIDCYFGYAPPQPLATVLQRLRLHVVYERHARGQWVLVAEPRA